MDAQSALSLVRTQLSAARSVSGDRRVRWWIALTLVVLVALAAIYSVYGYQQSTRAAAAYDTQRDQTGAAIQHARQQGFTAQDLKPITTRQNQITAACCSVWPGMRAADYNHQAAQLAALHGSLPGYLGKVLGQAKSTVNQQVASDRTLLQQNATQGGDVSSMQGQLDQIAQTVNGTSSIRAVRGFEGEAQRVGQEAAAQGAMLAQENAAIQQAAAAILAQTQDVDALRTQAGALLTQGRDDASVASYEAKPGRFKQIDSLMAAYTRLEFFTSKLAAPDLASVAFGTAAEQRYDGQIHQLLQTGLGPKHIVVSFQDQHVWAYENGQQVMDTPATTGIRGSTTDGTDFGPMKILHTDHPWTMVSPWPPGNPLYYPDTVVQYASFFTNSGESFHDASWEPDSELGPGSQFNAGTQSHGCIHVPFNLAQWVYGWAQVGTPVDVLPYDGSPVANQLAQMTTDNNGNPLTPA
ncbi:MAG: L,D-transpeptidase [Candidatus Dormibacteraeota bacterium]|nr:L,D-transpeptidase [Candidatus Dormibacteraeota bacterium]